MDHLPPKKTIKHYLYLSIGTAFGLGLSPYFPGTCGALLGVLIHALILKYIPESVQFLSIMIMFLLICASTIALTPWAEQYWQTRDPKHFVPDESAGYLLIPILFRPVQSWKTIIIGFILFRLFDIFKLIPPAGYIDKNIHGGWGVLLDDLVSAAYAAVILYIIYWIQPVWLKG